LAAGVGVGVGVGGGGGDGLGERRRWWWGQQLGTRLFWMQTPSSPNDNSLTVRGCQHRFGCCNHHPLHLCVIHSLAPSVA
jgi:hypothetical protein